MAPNFSKIPGSSRMTCEECWVTLAEDDPSAVKALTLAKCLRRVVTTRKIAVVICDDVSDNYRKILHANFDQCLKLDMPCERNGTPLRFYAKVFCWGMPFMRKCVFLDYETMVLKNCDELFAYPGTSAYVNDYGPLDSSILVLEPNFEDYVDLCNWLRSGKLHNVHGSLLDVQFGEWIIKRKRFSFLPKKYNLGIDISSGQAVWNNADVGIVRFNTIHPMDTLDNPIGAMRDIALVEKALIKYWIETYMQDTRPILKTPTELAMNWKSKLSPLAFPSMSQSILDGNREPIAIVGMSCRFPQADSLAEYWNVLANGVDCIRPVPEHRWPSALTDDYRKVQAGFLKCPVDQFDGKFFNISPFELTHTDPQQRFLLEVSWEALEHAGINPLSLSGSNTGVFVGTWTQDYRDLIKNVNGEFSDFHRTYMGTSLGGTSGRLSFLLGLQGPNIASESGCSSGMVAVYLACDSLRKRRSDIALAAGANLLLHPFKTKHMINVASPDGRCKTFDASADGFGRAEGCACIVLKRYSDAVKAGDNIVALIRGCGIAQEGTSRSYGTPTKEVQEVAMQAALDDAVVTPDEVSYVEAHGTGTLIGDTTEIAAITNLYCKPVHRNEPLRVASGKTNIGHTESCSGLAGIIKVALAMEHETMPAHIHLHNLNPHINLDKTNVKIPTASEKWERCEGKPRIAGISSFGITGTNTHIILQEAPKFSPPKLELSMEKDRPLNLLTFSAKTESALDAMLESYQQYFEKNPEEDIANVAFTLNTGRAHLAYRTAAIVSSNAEICQKLPLISKNKMPIAEKRPEICFLFTGQGSQFHGMAKTLYDSSPIFRMNFDHCEKLLQEKHGISLKPILWNEDSKNQLSRSLYSQISIFCIEFCIMKLWESWGLKPDAVLGHSLGEFAAAVCAGILEFEDALELVAQRSRLIEEKASPGKMIVVKADKSTVDKVLKEFLSKNKSAWLDYAAFNTSEQTVLAGPPKIVEAFNIKCREASLKTHILEASSAFHSRDMDSIIPEYKSVAEKIKYSTPKITYISGVTGTTLDSSKMNGAYWVSHVRDPVNFVSCSKTVEEMGYNVFLEIGPQPVLCSLIMSNVNTNEPATLLPSLRKSEPEWNTILTSLAKLYQIGVDIDWVNFDQFYNRKKVHLPITYPFARKTHWYKDENSQNGNGLFVAGTKPLHSLLGCQIPNATSNVIYQSSLELEQLSYLRDHAIGGHILFPAASFLEMSICSGCLSVTGQLDMINPMSIENLTVLAPLGLGEAQAKEKHYNYLQTVVSKEDGEETKICVYSKKSTSASPSSSSITNNFRWVKQATASFVPLQVNYRLHEETQKLTDIQQRCHVLEDTASFYEKLEEVGLEFGDNFKSLKRLWRNSSSETELLTEIKLLDNNGTQNSDMSENYIAHPIILDALIQTIMIGMDERLGGLNGSLYVPLVIGKTVLFSRILGGTFFAHSCWEENQPPEMRSATLYDENGNILAIMSGVQMVETTSQAIVKNLSNQNTKLPTMYEEIWRPRMGPMKNRTDLNILNGDNLFSTEFSQELAHCNEITDAKEEIAKNRKQLIYLYILKTFIELGWKPQIGEKIRLQEFSVKFGITPSLEKLLNRYFNILQEEGVLTEENDESTWKVVAVPQTNLTVIEEEISSRENFINENPMETKDIKVSIACCKKLGSFLTGKESALSFLFPEDKTTEICAETFYNESILVNTSHKAFKATVHKLMQNYSSIPEEQRGIIRVLEIGAGTGSATRLVLPIFENYKAKFQYTYTDISPAFFLKAQSMFETYGSKIQYKAMNIEEDPLGQGFIPGHYDIVIASNILHATRRLSESIGNVNLLLREGGVLLMVETMEKIREYDVVFGFLDGFWRYDDLEIRPDYPTINGKLWENIIRKEGFSKYQYFPCFGGQVGVIVAKTSNPNSATVLPPGKNKMESNWWLVFSDNSVYPEYLQRKFKDLRKNVIEIKKGVKFQEDDQYRYQVRPGEKEDFLKIFKMISENKLKIEGIAYLWGLDKKSQDQLEITTGFLFLAQILLSEFKGLPKFVLVTEGVMPVGDESATDITPSSLWGMIRSFRTEHFNMHVRSVDLDPDEEDLNLKYSELFTEFWNDDQEFQIAYRQRSRHVCRLVQIKEFANPLSFPNSERYSLVLPATKNIADLKFCPNGKKILKGNEVDVEVRATGLNFRDVFVVLKPDKQFDSINCLGLEFAGVCVRTGPDSKNIKVGDPVMGCQFEDNALPSHIQMDEDLLFKIPPGITFCEAATIPAAFATAYYCLVMVAKLRAGETVLIHAGSGGVGLCAIQVAKAVGANIIATAGSRRKRAFLRNLGVQQVFHSRKTDYAKQIYEVTKGQGVHVILNSLTSPGFKEASLSICCQNGRFVEMSKLHIWTKDEVRSLRKDVDYTVIDLTTVTKSTWKSFWVAVEDYLSKGLLHPIPYTRFEAPFIRDALTYMQKAKHIGKIIVVMPQMIPGESLRLEPIAKLFNKMSTYIVTGGLGGIGIELTKWMVKNGAKHIVLTSRRPPDENARKVIENLKSAGKNIVAMSVDVGNYQSCADMLKKIEVDSSLPKLRGIFHAAGTLSDATYVNQSVESFRTAFQGKVYGAWNLHQLSIGYPLEFFTMFSSMTSILGPVGLGNYSAANAYIDSLCHYRNNLGLIAQTINWGQWSEVGAAKDISMPAVKSFSPSQGLQALEIIMKTQKTQIAVLDVDFGYVRKLTSNVGTYLEELKITKGNQGAAFTVKIGNFWQDFNACEDEDSKDKKLAIIKSYVITILRQILKFDEDEVIDENQNFSEMGMDSLMMLEMKNFLQTMLGKNITMNVSEMAELTTVHKLANHVLLLISKSSSTSISRNPNSCSNLENNKNYFEFTPDVRSLIEEDMKLCEIIKGNGKLPCLPQNITIVLLTGVTGKLGLYMLNSLLSLSQVKKVYCLIRSQDRVTAKNRLVKYLQEKDLQYALNQLETRVECLPGDITDPWLGLTAELYDDIALIIDAVVHCAVKGNLMCPYVKPDELEFPLKSSKNTVRQVNVVGTKNVLAFAASQKTKRVLHASTLLACHKVTEDDLLFEDWQDPSDVYEMTNVGYPVSKFICEILTKQANDRGVPVQVHRFPGLMGDKNGCFSFPNNHAIMRLLGFCKLGAMPEIPIPLQVLDVDFAADISTKLFFAEENDTNKEVGCVFNITNPNMNLIQDFPKLAEEFGFKIDIVPYEEFSKTLDRNEEEMALVFPYKEVDMEGSRYTDFTLSPNVMQCWNRNPENFFISRRIPRVISNYNDIVTNPEDILRRDMQYAKKKGIFTKMKLITLHINNYNN